MTSKAYPFFEAGQLVAALRRVDALEQRRLEALRAEMRERREQLMNAAPKAVQELVVQAMKQEAQGDGE